MPKITLSAWKTSKEKIFQSYECGFGTKRVRPEKYETLKKALKEWLLIWFSGNVQVSGLLKKKSIEFVCHT